MAFEDSRLKHRLLQSLMMAHLPDEKQLPRSPSQLSVAVASIRRHHLLSEAQSTGITKSTDSRRSIVDGWVDYVLGLLCSTVAENRWAGLCLLGVTCQECSRQRFLESYNAWFQKLLLPLKQSADPVFIRAAACAALTDLLTRLGNLAEYAGVRRDAAALIAKMVQPILQCLGDKDSSGIWNEALDLLSATLRCFPACLRQLTNNLETILVARLMDTDNPVLSQKCATSLALLPKAHGDSTVWSSMIRRLLIAINTDVEYAFSGMEDVASAKNALATLLPMGQDPPWPLGGPSVAANTSAQAAKSFWQQLVPRVSALMQCCQYLITYTYPVPVPLPLKPLLALAARILRVDGSRLVLPSTMSATQVSLCSELPALHASALDLLNALLCGVRSQLLPHAGDVVRLVSDYFRRPASVAPVLRVKLYGFARHLFVAMGAGMASSLAPAVVGSALSDLKGSTLGSCFSPKVSRTSRMSNAGWVPSNSWAGQSTNHRKRKEPGAGVPVDHQNGTSETAHSMGEGTAPAAVQIAALRALEALLTSGGGLLPERWRAEVDEVLASVAMAAATGNSGLAVDQDAAFSDGAQTVSCGAFQVAAYRALLASLLSPCCHRPPFLAQGLSIFRKGRHEAGSEVAEVCAHALLALEPLIHPRCLPPAPVIHPGLGAGRILSAGGIVPQLRKSAKSLPSSGNAGIVPVSSANMNFPGTEVPPALKIAQMAMDPWAEVDTWLGYGEDFGEQDGLLVGEDNNMLVDELHGGLESGVGSAADYYDSEQQNGDACYNEPAVEKVGERNANNLAMSPEGTELPEFTSGSVAEDGPVQNCELAAGTLELEDPLEARDAYGHHLRENPEGLTEMAISVKDDCPSPNRQDILFSSELESLEEHKDVSIDDKTAGVTMAPESGTVHIDDLANSFDLDSDSDGVLPDIVDADPDSD